MLSRKPNSLSYIEAASVPVVAVTAWQGLFDHARLEAGQTVVIHGAAGSVGAFAVQLAPMRALPFLSYRASQRMIPDILRKIDAYKREEIKLAKQIYSEGEMLALARARRPRGDSSRNRQKARHRFIRADRGDQEGLSFERAHSGEFRSSVARSGL
jgi:hypothetical protein